jgi:large subunit ribosomal protein L2
MKKYKPTTPSKRHQKTVSYRGVLTKSDPQKSLTYGFKRSVGRNNQGRITSRHKGGGHKRLYRQIDFKYDKQNISAKIVSIEYDPNRNAFIGLAIYADGEKRYVIVPQKIKVGDVFMVGEKAPLKTGNRLPLKLIPVGTFVYNVEIKPKNGSKLARSAGTFIQVVANDAGFSHLKMPSTEIRKVSQECYACLGEVSNSEYKLQNFGKAGRSRWKGIKPRVRGSAMNPVDHPYGGGEGAQGRGLRRAKTKWGKPSGKGQKTRKPKKYSNPHILSRRRVGKNKKTAK